MTKRKESGSRASKTLLVLLVRFDLDRVSGRISANGFMTGCKPLVMKSVRGCEVASVLTTPASNGPPLESGCPR